ncbi:hypothetical protein [Williamsia maris]
MSSAGASTGAVAAAGASVAAGCSDFGLREKRDFRGGEVCSAGACSGVV